MNTANNNFQPRRENGSSQKRPERRPMLEQRRPNAPMNTAMKDSLAILMRQSLQHASPADRAPFARTNLGAIPNDNQDGITHVNFGPTAQTQLGQVLSFSNQLRFWHPALGIEVPSMQHFWIFLQDGARNLGIFKFGNDKLRAFMRKNGSGKYLPNQYALLAQAYWYKFQEHQLLSELFVDVDALFDYYINDARGRRRPQSAAHLVDILKAIRAALRNNREPDYSAFLDRDVQIEMQDLRGNERAYRIADLLASDVVQNLEIVKEETVQQPQNHNKLKRQQTKEGTTGYLQAVTGVSTMTELNKEHAVCLGVVTEPSATSMGLTYPEEVEAALASMATTDENLKVVARVMSFDFGAGEDIQKVSANVFEKPLNNDVKFGSDIRAAFVSDTTVGEDGLLTENVHAPAAPVAPTEPAQPSAPNEPSAPQAPAAPVAPGAQDDGNVIDFGGFKPVMATLTN